MQSRSHRRRASYKMRIVVKWEVACVEGRPGAIYKLDCGHQAVAIVNPNRIIDVGYTRARCYACAKPD